MNLRSIAPVLLLCLLLAGCGAAEREEETGALESAAGLTENQEDFLTVDGEAVPAWRYLYWRWTAGDWRNSTRRRTSRWTGTRPYRRERPRRGWQRQPHWRIWCSAL